MQHPLEVRHLEIARRAVPVSGVPGGEPGVARPEELRRRGLRALVAEDRAEVPADQRDRLAPEELAGVTVRGLDPAAGADEQHAVGGRLEDLRQLESLGL